MKTSLRLSIATFGLATFNLSAATLLVSLESTNPVAPFATWATAANVIQDAVDAAQAGDTVLVTNGVYAVGSREVSVLDTNQEPPVVVGTGLSRVVVTNSIRLESVNGPLVTTIRGEQITDEWGRIVGLRCVYLGTNAVLSGVTLTNGWAGWGRSGGGVYSEPSAVVTNCTLTGNTAHGGGGANGGTLYNCTLTDNGAGAWGKGTQAAGAGGGALGCTLYNCHVTSNYSSDGDFTAGLGGGAADCTLYNCTLTGNSTLGYSRGGGASGSTLYNCTLTGNSTDYGGGGANSCWLYNSTLTGNSAQRWGGGAYGCTLFNCVLSGNSVSEYGGGGAAYSTLYNCIAYYNTAPIGANYFTGVNDHGEDVSTLLCHSCTTPLPTNGLGNIDADPRFVNAAAGDFRLREDSPCIDAGTNLSSLIQTDIEGQFRPQDGNKDGVAAFDIGAYEFRPSPVTLYVSLQSTNPVAPFATWETAANVIQDAVDAAKARDTVLVTNGVYAVGSRDGNRVAVTNAIRLESVNGPQVTTVVGSTVVTTNEHGEDVREGGRCVYLGTNAVLSGFTLRGGSIGGGNGGGVYSESASTVTNCILSGNSNHAWVTGADAYGGGAYGGTLYNCLLTGNTASSSSGYARGGGAYNCTLYRCTLTDNRACFGGGAASCTLFDCTVTDNSVVCPHICDGAYNGSGAYESTLYDCTVTANASVGASDSTLYNCTITGNEGVGASHSTLYNCTITGNAGGGVETTLLYNCTVTGNAGGGVKAAWGYSEGSTAFNSILYYNSGGNFDEGTALNFCCTTPRPTNGVGNITGSALFMDMAAGDFRLREDSPCIDAGTNLLGVAFTDPSGGDLVAYAHDATDILGNTRFIDGNGDGTVAWDIGAYEFNSFKPPRFAVHPQRTAEGWTLNITGPQNKWVHLQRSGNLMDWEEVWSGWMGTEGAHQCNDGDTGQKVMFYRVVVP
jgi:hypothetical protein